ncbi:MAG: isoaspartyl peptidase/L-asparaginase family protein [Cytophagaceae bacterium]
MSYQFTILLTFNLALLINGEIMVQQNGSLKESIKPVLVIHGGAGNITPQHLDASARVQYEHKLKEALEVGYAILNSGGSGLDAVETTVKILEDSPLFNAGKGSVLTMDGKVEMDASVMSGKDLNAGAVASVRTIKNPISAARRVMEASPHVLLVGEGAEQFSAQQNVEIVSEDYFLTDRRKQELERIKKRKDSDTTGNIHLSEDLDKYGTVGAVALDKHGNLYAATSTGGMANKKFGRVGDSPIIGAGTYASNQTCAVSCTGHGEYFIRLQVAKEVSSLMAYKNMTLKEASEFVIHNLLDQLGGTGGLIAVDKHGNVSMPFNTSGMFRGYIKEGKVVVEIFK